jgi:hypothetical protein
MRIYQGLPVYVTLDMAAQCPAVCNVILLVEAAQGQDLMRARVANQMHIY